MRRPICTGTNLLCCCGLLLATQHTNAWRIKGSSVDGDVGGERLPLTSNRRRLHASTNEAVTYSWEQREPAVVVKDPMGGGLTRAFDQAFNDAATAKVARSRLRTDCRKPRKKKKSEKYGGESESESGKGGSYGDERYSGDSFGADPSYTQPPDVYYPAPSPVVDGYYTPDYNNNNYYPAPSPYIVGDPVVMPMPTAYISPPTATYTYTHTHYHIHWIDGVRHIYHSHPHTHTYTVVYGGDGDGADPINHHNGNYDPIVGDECGGDYYDPINPDYMAPYYVPAPTPMPVDDPVNRPIFVPTPTGDDPISRPVFVPTMPTGDDPVSRPVFVPTGSIVAPTEDGVARPTFPPVVTPTLSTVATPVASPMAIIDPTMSTVNSPVDTSQTMPSPSIIIDPTMSTNISPIASPTIPSPNIMDPTMSTANNSPIMPSPSIIIDPTMSTITTPIASPSMLSSPSMIIDPTMSTIFTPIASPGMPSPNINIDPTMSTISTPIASPSMMSSPSIIIDPTMSTISTPIASPATSPSSPVINGPSAGVVGMQPISTICSEYRSGTAPTTGNREEHSLFVVLNVDSTVEEGKVLSDLSTALQTFVGPTVLGCLSRRNLSSSEQQQHKRRTLQQGSQITNIDFAQPVRDETVTCTQAVADSKCIPVQVDATVFYNGSQPPEAGGKLRQALFLLPAGSIEGFQGWGEIGVAPTGQEPGTNTTVDNGNPPLNDSDEKKGVEPGRTPNSIAFIAAAAASLVAILAALFLIRRHRKQSEKGTVAKVREFTDDEDDLGAETNDESFDGASYMGRAPVAPRKKMVYVLNDEFSANESVSTGVREVYKNIRPSPYETTNSPGTRFIVADIFHEKSRTASSSRNYTANDTVQL